MDRPGSVETGGDGEEGKALIAAQWLMWEHNMSIEQAKRIIAYPNAHANFQRLRDEAMNVAYFCDYARRP